MYGDDKHAPADNLHISRWEIRRNYVTLEPLIAQGTEFVCDPPVSVTTLVRGDRMSDVARSIVRLMKTARCLRAAADELGELELKSRIVDEITTLQEIRDDLSESGSQDHVDDAGGGSEVKSDAATEPGVSLSDAALGILQPTGASETYSLTAESDVEPAIDEAVATRGAGEDAAETGDQRNESRNSDVGERRAVIEMRIADLVQLEQVATRRLHEIPTSEQRKLKARASQAGAQAGKAGKELQHYAVSAMKLSAEQRAEIQAVRKDILALREAITKERQELEKLAAPGK